MRTQGLPGRRGSVTHEQSREGKAVRCRCGFSIRGSERFIADQVAALGSVCPSCGATWKTRTAMEGEIGR